MANVLHLGSPLSDLLRVKLDNVNVGVTKDSYPNNFHKNILGVQHWYMVLDQEKNKMRVESKNFRFKAATLSSGLHQTGMNDDHKRTQ